MLSPEIQHCRIRKCHCQRFLCNLAFIECNLCVVFKKPYRNFPVRQAAFTLDIVFLLDLSENRKVRVRYAFFTRFILPI